MEEAAYITRIASLAGVEARHGRLYFGAEFCQLRQPTLGQVERAHDLARGRGMGFTLVTPFVTDSGMDHTLALVDFLGAQATGAEVVVNDWGVLRRLRERGGLTPVLGRLLSRQRRDPMIGEVIDRLPEETAEHLRGGSTDNPVVQDYLAGLGVARVELDNLVQGIRRRPGLPASLYLPWAYVSTTRRCRLCGCDGEGYAPERIPARCDRACERHAFTVDKDGAPRQLLLVGNTQFVDSGPPPEDLAELGVDRLVHQLDLV